MFHSLHIFFCLSINFVIPSGGISVFAYHSSTNLLGFMVFLEEIRRPLPKTLLIEFGEVFDIFHP